jgi:hypothetical protein
MNVTNFEAGDWLDLQWQSWLSLNPVDGDLGEIIEHIQPSFDLIEGSRGAFTKRLQRFGESGEIPVEDLSLVAECVPPMLID